MIKSMRIKGAKYKIKMVDMLDNGATCGELRRSNKTIYIAEHIIDGDKKIKNDIQVTFFHEFYHAVLQEISVDDVLNDAIEEIIVDNLAQCTIDLFNNELKKAEEKDEQASKRAD